MQSLATYSRRRALFSRLLVACLVMLLATVFLPACGGNPSTESVSPANSAGVTATSAARPGTSTTEATVAGAQAVTFTTSDGIALSGHLFGSGPSGVVLCHMYPADQTSWYETARKLAARGYQVLTFDFRGYGGSGGDKQIEHIDRDALAAASQMAATGATKIVFVGASMGGTASLVAAQALLAAQPTSNAANPSPAVAGVATLSAPVSFKGLSAEAAVPKLSCPLLFIAAEKDAGAAGARELQELAGDAGVLQILPGADHGTDLLTGAQAERVMDLLLAFLKKTLT